MNATTWWKTWVPVCFRPQFVFNPAKSSGRRSTAVAGGRRPQDVPILVVSQDRWFRDRVLIPSLRALQFADVCGADSLAQARHVLSPSTEPGILVYDAPRNYAAPDKSVADLVRGRSLSLVLLHGESVAAAEVAEGGAELVIFKRGTTVLDTVRAIEDVARRRFADWRRRRADDRSARRWESPRGRDRSRDVQQQQRGWGQRGDSGRGNTPARRTIR